MNRKGSITELALANEYVRRGYGLTAFIEPFINDRGLTKGMTRYRFLNVPLIPISHPYNRFYSVEKAMNYLFVEECKLHAS